MKEIQYITIDYILLYNTTVLLNNNYDNNN